MPKTQRGVPGFADAASRAGVVSRVPVGVRPIRVKRIVGSVGKSGKIGTDFLPLGPGPANSHFRSMMQALEAGEHLQPITVYQLGNRYFVVDGHTRVAAAKALGAEFIDADITEALPSREGETNLTHYARREFERATALEGIRLTSAWRYRLLQHHIEGYQLYLERSRDRDASLPEAARIWFRTQYLPTLLEIRRRRLPSRHGGRTAGDVYTDILKDWSEEGALGASLREMLDRFDADRERERSVMGRARRRVATVVDAALPKAIAPLGTQDSRTFTESDIEDELRGIDTDEQNPGNA